MSGRNAQDFVTPEARYSEHEQEMSGVPRGVGGGGVAMYPLYGLGQASAAVDPNAWYRRPMFVLPFGVALGVGIGWGVWGWFMPRLKKSVRKNLKREEE